MANSNESRQIAIREEEKRVGREITALLDARTNNFRDVLPPQVTVEEFKRSVLTAIAEKPDLRYADRRTLITSAMRCAADGLLPDGRRAALVVYNTKIKERDPNTGLDVERRIDAVQYLPMAFGIREQLRNSGEVTSAVAEAVHQNDKFRYRLGDNAYIEHEPPPLGEDRGEVIGAYCIITLRNGEVIRDVMDRKRIEKARGQSRAKDSLMWTSFYDEGAKKTILKHAAKQAPLSPKLVRLLNRDDEPLTIEETTGQEVEQREPEPVRSSASDTLIPPEDNSPKFAVVDHDGVENVFSQPGRATECLRLMLQEGEKLGLAQLEGLWETNQPTLEALSAVGHGEQIAGLAGEYAAAVARLQATIAAKQTVHQQAASPSVDQQDRAGPQQTPAQPAAAARAQQDLGGQVVDQEEPLDHRENLAIAPVVHRGNTDWRTWAVAMFLPKLRRIRDPRVLAFFLGDNAQHLEAAKASGALDRDRIQELNEAIRHQNDLVSRELAGAQ